MLEVTSMTRVSNFRNQSLPQLTLAIRGGHCGLSPGFKSRSESRSRPGPWLERHLGNSAHSLWPFGTRPIFDCLECDEVELYIYCNRPSGRCNGTSSMNLGGINELEGNQ